MMARTFDKIGLRKFLEIICCSVYNSPLAKMSADKKLSNNSGRKTTVRKLKAAGVRNCDIASNVTGHTSAAGLDAYDSGNEDEQRSLSMIIDGVKQPLSNSFQARKINSILTKHA